MAYRRSVRAVASLAMGALRRISSSRVIPMCTMFRPSMFSPERGARRSAASARRSLPRDSAKLRKARAVGLVTFAGSLASSAAMISSFSGSPRLRSTYPYLLGGA